MPGKSASVQIFGGGAIIGPVAALTGAGADVDELFSRTRKIADSRLSFISLFRTPSRIKVVRRFGCKSGIRREELSRRWT